MGNLYLKIRKNIHITERNMVLLTFRLSLEKRKSRKSTRQVSTEDDVFWSFLTYFPFFLYALKTSEILRISPYSVRMRESTNQNNCECGHFSRSESQGV